MAWTDLDSELASMFGELSTSVEKIAAALYIQGQWQSATAQAYLQDWRRRNRARCNAYLREWRAANREKVLAYRAKWREKNRERLRTYEREKAHRLRSDPEYLKMDRARKAAYARRARAEKSVDSRVAHTRHCS